MAIDRLQLSRKPAWAVQAYHALRLLPAIVGDVVPSSENFISYNYWFNPEVSRTRACCIPAALAFASDAN